MAVKRWSNGKSQRLNHLMVLHIHVNLAKDIDLIQVTKKKFKKIFKKF